MKSILLLIAYIGFGGMLIYLLLYPPAPAPAIGTLLDPWHGLYYTARRTAPAPQLATAAIPGLESEVSLVRDARGVPHIFAGTSLDAVAALGYAVAQDRLFQMDFLPRVAAGRLASVMGADLVDTDLALRKTGMLWGAQRNLARIQQEAGLEHDIVEAYVRGVNAYIDELAPHDLPFEFRLLGYAPERYTPLHVLLILQYMTYDLTYRSDDARAGGIVAQIGPDAYELLFPGDAPVTVPIVPEPGGRVRDVVRRPVFSARAAVPEARAREALALGTLTEGYVPGKGSNNWAVAGARSATGAPILAGDMHLSLSLPAIWYEAHLVAPGLNVYGVTIPGAPLPVQAFNDRIGWTFTNTGSDQIDHLALQLNEDSSAYLHNGQYRPFEVVPDTIFVKGTPPAIGALHYAHWGPADLDAEPPTALRWVAHEPSHTLTALWHMNHASSYEAFQEAIRFWDTPMQNILYADADGNIAIRSTGLAPLRRTPDGTGLLDGSTDAHEWVGRIPFDELPHSYNPGQGYLASTNQQPADSTYPYYLGRDWAPGYRSLRIDALLGSKDRHTLQDLKAYQGDVYVVQRDLFAPLLDSVGGLSPRANELRNLLNRWSGDATIDRPEPLVLDLYLDELERQVWDEPVFQRYERPDQTALYALIVEAPDSKWFDRANTPATEHAPDIMRTALETVADTLEARYGWERARWRWGDHHTVLFRHFTRSEALRPLWRGPYEYPGFASTLSPAADPVTTHSASWRVVVDFSTTPATGYGVYPGGQSGNPFSPLYDAHIETYLQFRHYPLDRPSTVDEIARDLVRAHVRLVPG